MIIDHDNRGGNNLCGGGPGGVRPLSALFSELVTEIDLGIILTLIRHDLP